MNSLVSTALVIAVSALGVATATQAQTASSDWPNKAIRMVVTFPPGSSSDAVVRSWCHGLARSRASPWWWTTGLERVATLGWPQFVRKPFDAPSYNEPTTFPALSRLRSSAGREP